MGSLEAVQGVVDAPAEESSLAPSIASVETNIDDASISVITKATGAVDSGGGDSAVAKKATSYTNNIGGTGYGGDARTTCTGPHICFPGQGPANGSSG